MSGRIVRTQAERLSGYVRVLEARSPDASPERFRSLAVDEIRPVRLWTARSPLTPPDALDQLARDEDQSVQWNALINPNLPDTALRWLADLEAEEAGTRWFTLRERIVHHPRASAALRAELVAAGACSCPRPCGRNVYARQVSTGD
ncbi:hypothetical protein [Streptomyces sp. NPDC021020]|uniref:hypothetical protein n=1 Tax=Streptomyces sp. NPDC021020 TaxID=3365109 RepID=UPI00378C79D3